MTEKMENAIPDPNQQYGEVFENRNYMRFVMDKMDSAAAEILNLRYVLGKSFKEIAKLLNIKNSTARVRAYRSKKMFVQAYKEYDNNYEY